MSSRMRRAASARERHAAMHRGKRVWTGRARAEHAASEIDYSRAAEHYVAYPCRWHDDHRRGERAPRHWHTGRKADHEGE